ncbi:MAG: DUF5666 domain-containing protein [Candidatus Paceibacterota bacterium]|jgi:hypothetical protein
MKSKRFVFLSVALVLVVGSALALTASAAGTPIGPNGAKSGLMRGLDQKFGQRDDLKPVVFGVISAVSGNTLTLTGRLGPGRAGPGTSTSAKVFTVDVTNAKIIKNNATSSIAGIVVGDTVMVQGTVSGANITATIIRAGVMRGPGQGGEDGRLGSSTLPAIVGNGQPVVAGTISAISGTTLTITNKSNVTYTVDASNAKILQGRSVGSISNIKINDPVVIQGAVNGNSITASSVIDQAKPTNANGQPTGSGFFAGIGQFFSRLFGF